MTSFYESAAAITGENRIKTKEPLNRYTTFRIGGKADFIAKLQIALKEANETGYWLELLLKTNYISENQFKELDKICTSLRAMLVASINTAKGNVR